MRAPLRAPKIDKIEFSLQKVNFLPFSRDLHLIVKVRLLSAYNDQFMNENIHNVKYFHVGIKKFVRALWCARDLDEINIFSLKRSLYDFDKIYHPIAKIRTKHMFIQRLIHVKHHSKKYYISKM